MDNYIQNKLDAFKEYLVLDENSEEEFSNEILTNKLKEVITEAYNQGKTDYHNHIVEMVKGMPEMDILVTQQENSSDNGIHPFIHKTKLLDFLLQDTNPKE